MYTYFFIQFENPYNSEPQKGEYSLSLGPYDQVKVINKRIIGGRETLAIFDEEHKAWRITIGDDFFASDDLKEAEDTLWHGMYISGWGGVCQECYPGELYDPNIYKAREKYKEARSK